MRISLPLLTVLLFVAPLVGCQDASVQAPEEVAVDARHSLRPLAAEPTTGDPPGETPPPTKTTPSTSAPTPQRSIPNEPARVAAPAAQQSPQTVSGPPATPVPPLAPIAVWHMRPPEIAALPSMKGKDLDASLAKLTAGSGAEALVPRLTIVRQLGARLVDLERYTYLVNAIRPADTPPEQVARLGRYVDAYQLTFVDAVPRQAATRLFAEPQSIADAARLPIYVSATDPDSYALCLINEKTLIYGERNVVVAMLNQDPAAKQGYAGDALARGHLGLSMKFDRVPWPWNAMGVEPVTARLIEKNLDRSTAVAVLGTKPTAEVILTAKGRFSAATTAFALRAGVQDLRGKVGKLLEPPEGIPLPPAARPLVDAAKKFGDDTVRSIEVRQEGLDVIVTLREFAELDDLLALVKSLRPLGPR